MLADPSIAGRTLDLDFSGERFQGTVAELVRRFAPKSPSDDALLRAARRDLEQSPAMLEEKARWIEIEDRLRRAGLSTREIVQVVLHGAGGAFGFPVSEDVIAGVVRASADEALAVEICDTALADGGLSGAALGAIEVLVRAGRLDARFAELVSRVVPQGVVQPPPTDADGLTAAARDAYEHTARAHRDVRAREDLGALARAAHDRHLRVDAPELATMETWREASPARREAAARTIAARTKGVLAYVEMHVHADVPIAVLRHEPSGTRFSLVPGGVFERGLSAAEEALLRHRAAARDSVAAEAASLLDRIAEMRPTAEVRTGPVLVAQEVCFTGRASHVAMFLEGEPFRLLSEAEWERLSRGSLRGALTARGHHVPDEGELADLVESGAERSNAFGLWGFGLLPELCADAWHPSYEGAPLDGSPRWGDGPRVIRGGAAELSPWQGRGEWHLLCNAVRGSQEGWEIYAVRPALGVVIA